MSEPELKHAGLNLGPYEEMTPQEAEAGVFGFWLFLMSDAIIFALLFATYGVMVAATAGGPTPGGVFQMGSAFAETLLLLTSSFTFAMGSVALKYGQGRAALLAWLLVTLALGAGFLGLEIHDFVTMAAQGATPQRSGFLSAFFALTPLHGLHVAAGSLWIVVMIWQVLTVGLDDRVKINLIRLGLFWHFLDIIWIGIFSVVYLQGLIR